MKFSWRKIPLYLLYVIIAWPLAITAKSMTTNLIQPGSACIGLQCVDDESFDYDTLRLKEDNVRLEFQDTSSTANYPTRDWRITVNDQTDGGNNFWAIDSVDNGERPFTIEYLAPTDSLVVDYSGRIGIGTEVPIQNIHIFADGTTSIRLEDEDDRSWDMAGNYYNYIIREVTTSTTTYPLRIRAGAPTWSFVIEPSGNIGLGLENPRGRLHTWDGVGGSLVWSYAGLDGTLRSILLDGTGDVTARIRWDYVVHDSAGNTAHGTLSAPPGTTRTITVGANTVTIYINANGSVEIQRTAGTDTIDVIFKMFWL